MDALHLALDADDVDFSTLLANFAFADASDFMALLLLPHKLARDGFVFDNIGLSFHLAGPTSFLVNFSCAFVVLIVDGEPVLVNFSIFAALFAVRLPFN